MQREQAFNNQKKISSLNVLPNFVNSFNTNSINLINLDGVNKFNNGNYQNPFVNVQTSQNNNNDNNYNNSLINISISNPFLFEKLSALLHDFKHIVYDNLIYFDYLVSNYIHPLMANQTALYNLNDNKTGVDSNINLNIKEMNNNTLTNNLIKPPQKTNTINLNNNNDNNNNNGLNFHKNSLFGGTLISNKTTNAPVDINKLKEDLVYLNVIKEYTISLILYITNFMSDNEFLAGNSMSL